MRLKSKQSLCSGAPREMMAFIAVLLSAGALLLEAFWGCEYGMNMTVIYSGSRFSLWPILPVSSTLLANSRSSWQKGFATNLYN